MNKKPIEEKIRLICIYHSDDPLGGTNGYALSEEQFQKLFALFEAEQLELIERVRMGENKKDELIVLDGNWKGKITELVEYSLKTATLHGYNQAVSDLDAKLDQLRKEIEGDK